MTEKILGLLAERQKVKDILSANSQTELIQKLKSYGVEADSKVARDVDNFLKQIIKQIQKSGSTELNDQDIENVIGGALTEGKAKAVSDFGNVLFRESPFFRKAKIAVYSVLGVVVASGVLASGVDLHKAYKKRQRIKNEQEPADLELFDLSDDDT